MSHLEKLISELSKFKIDCEFGDSAGVDSNDLGEFSTPVQIYFILEKGVL